MQQGAGQPGAGTETIRRAVERPHGAWRVQCAAPYPATLNRARIPARAADTVRAISAAVSPA
ncbi:MAG: hypothetical protein ACK4OP_03770, partial [Gemmobacter sp.]